MEMVCPRKLKKPQDDEHEHAPRASDLTQGLIWFIFQSFIGFTIALYEYQYYSVLSKIRLPLACLKNMLPHW